MRWPVIVSWIVLGWTALAADAPIRVVTSFLPAYSLARQVAGEQAVVENLLAGAASPHDHQLSPSELARLTKADVLVINGLGLESFLDRPLSNQPKERRAAVIELAGRLGSDAVQDAGGSTNPHVWLDPRLMMRAATNLAQTLARLAPAQAATFQANAAHYAARLEALDREMQAALEPVRGVPFVTYHNAFPYLARRYGLTLAGVVESNAEEAPTARERSALLRRIRETKAKAIFGTVGENPRLARQLARDTGLKFAELDAIETGDLTPDGYEEAMRRNLKALVETLR